MRRIADYALQKAGFALVGSGGLPRFHRYRVHRLRLPEPVTSGFLRATAFEVDLDRVTTPCGFSYAPDGWHPYRETLDQLLVNPDLPYESTALCRFYDGFQPSTVQEALLEDASEPVEPLCRWPPRLALFKHLWSLTPRDVSRILAAPHLHKGPRQQFGPQDAEFGRVQVRRMWDAYRSVRDNGYQPEAYHDGHLTGYFLVRGDDYRFVVFYGNHRLAAFRALGVQRLLARVHPTDPPAIHWEDLEASSGNFGVLPADVARRVFTKLFEETGRPKARAQGLV